LRALTIIATIFASQTAHADEPVTLNKVPPAVLSTAGKLSPRTRYTKVFFDEANKYYKLRGKDAEGRDVRVVSDETAEFVQVTVSVPVPAADVPRAVVETHERTTRGAGRFRFKATTILRSEQSTAGVGAKTVLFEFFGKNADGERMRQVVREDGVNIGLGEARD
jgi:hypothetical protein